MPRRRLEPPPGARLLLRLRRLREHRIEIESDLHELFELRLKERGPRYARIHYWLDALSLWQYRPNRRYGVAKPRPRGAVDMLMQDLTFAFRLFRREPAVVAVTLGGLALTIAISTAVFSMLNAAALRPIGVADPAATVRVWRTYARGASSNWSYREYFQLREAARLSRVEGFIREAGPFGIAPEDPGVTTTVHLVAGGYFSTFGGRMAVGRPLTRQDDVTGAQVVAVVNYGFWRRWFGGDRSIVGRTVYFFGRPVTIVGVAERSFTGPVVEGPAFWLPLASAQSIWSYLGPFHPASAAQVTVSARLNSGVAGQAAEKELAALASSLATGDPASRTRTTGVSLAPADNRSARDVRVLVTGVMIALMLVLLLACVNVANLLLANATTRRREIGMRLALGAGRGRIVRQLLTESLMLSVLAGSLGLLAAVWVLPVILSLVHLPETTDVSPDARVYSFAALAALVAGVAAGLAPAHYGSRSNLLSCLTSDTSHAGTQPRVRRLRSCFVGAQAAASILLLVIAALLVRAEYHVTHRGFGFDVDRLMGVSPGFPRAQYDAGRASQYWTAALARVKSLPGVEAAALVEHPPFGGSTQTSSQARGGQPFVVHFNRTSEDFFRTAGIHIFSGRPYTAAEVASGAPVAIVSRSLAREFWGDENPLGGTLKRVSENLSGVQVIGVASDAASSRLTDATSPTVYLPFSGDQTVATLIIRARTDPDSLVRPVRESLRAIDPSLRSRPWLVRDGLSRQLQRAEALSALGGIAGLLALGLAVTGIFGVTAFVVSQRVPEIGIRLALGATTRDVMQLLTRDALRPVVIGLAIGMFVALLGTGVLSAVLYGISPRDPFALAGAGFVLLGAAYLAVLIPVRRAIRINPASLLRQ